MLQSRNLDDQTFDEIVEAAVGRLPWLCPDWTDHNAHDPGITVLELLAWYKEMQQYHMNRITDDIKRKLLKLVGIVPNLASAAECYVRPESVGESCPRLTRLVTREEIVYELDDPIGDDDPDISCCLIQGPDGYADVTALMEDLKISAQPFWYGETRTELDIGFEHRPAGRFRIWFEVDEPEDCPRNPYTDDDQVPRTIAWQASGGVREISVLDKTHAMSQDGFMTFDVPEGWAPETLDGRTMYWLRAALRNPGCEDEVRLCGISSRYYRAVQRETRSRPAFLTVAAEARCTVLFDDALSLEAAFTVFLRTGDGWQQCMAFDTVLRGGRRGVELDAGSAAEDGEPNLLVAASDGIHYRELFFDSDGLPDQTIDLRLGGRQALTGDLLLICDTLCEDGTVRPEVWRLAEDFYAATKRSRVFTYDPDRETITFGSGRQGAVVPAGKAAIFIAGLTLSNCSGGNIPAGSELLSPKVRVTHTPAGGGRDRETVASASARLLKLMGQPQRCVSAADYERVALQTPGLRIRAARAIPGYDPVEPAAGTGRPVVTLVAVPFGQAEHPMPDAAFLKRIRAEVECRRPICNVVRVIAPVYVGISVSVQIKIRGRLGENDVRRAIEEHLSLGRDDRRIGDKIGKNEISSAVQAVPGVLRVTRLELRALGPDCYVNSGGDAILPKNAVPYLKTLDLETS